MISHPSCRVESDSESYVAELINSQVRVAQVLVLDLRCLCQVMQYSFLNRVFSSLLKREFLIRFLCA